MLRSRCISISISSIRMPPPSSSGIGSMLTTARFKLTIAIRFRNGRGALARRLTRQLRDPQRTVNRLRRHALLDDALQELVEHQRVFFVLPPGLGHGIAERQLNDLDRRLQRRANAPAALPSSVLHAGVIIVVCCSPCRLYTTWMGLPSDFSTISTKRFDARIGLAVHRHEGVATLHARLINRVHAAARTPRPGHPSADPSQCCHRRPVA